jgi:hypothetical protein
MMMNLRSISLPAGRFAIVAVFLISTGVIAMLPVLTSNNSRPALSGDNLGEAMNSGYEEHWRQVDSLEKLGLPRSALVIVDMVHEQAMAEDNFDQILKSFIYKTKFEFSFENTYYTNQIEKFERKLSSSEFPLTPVLHSMLGELYWRYFQQNRHRYYNRTRISGNNLHYIDTWDLETILDTARYHYIKSTGNINELRSAVLEDVYREIIEKPDHSLTQPTLYDFLIFRAIKFFSNTETSVTRVIPAYNFSRPELLEPYNKFIRLDLAPTDTTDHNYIVMKLYQALLGFHAGSKNIEALVDIELSRLGLIYTVSGLSGKENILIGTLRHLREEFKKDRLVRAEITVLLAQTFLDRSENNKEIVYEEYRDDFKIAHDLCLEIIDSGYDYPERIASICSDIIKRVTAKDLSATVENVNLPGENFPALIGFRNIDSVYVKIIQLPFDKTDKLLWELSRTGKNFEEKSYDKRVVDSLNTFHPLRAVNYKMPHAGDYRHHRVEIVVPSLPAGQYAIMFSDRENFSYSDGSVIYDFISVSSISFINRPTRSGDLEYYLLDRKTGKALEGVTATIHFRSYDHRKGEYITKSVGNLRSDNNGYLLIKAETSGYYNIDFRYKNDRLSARPGRHGHYSNYIGRTNNYLEQVTTRTFFFTDRAIYRPGQTVYFKGITYSTDGKKKHSLITRGKSTVVLLDVNRKEVAKLDVVTNEYGSFSGSFIIPQGLLNGVMTIRNNHGSKSIIVEEYKRPRFSVTISQPDGFYRIGEDINLTGQAKAFSGAMTGGANVRYRVTRSIRAFPYFRHYRELEVVNGETVTNENGEFIIGFNAIPDYSIPKSSGTSYIFTIKADVTDLNGETQSASRSVHIGSVAMVVEPEIPDYIERKEGIKLNIRTTNQEGAQQSALCTVKIYLLEPPPKAYRERLWEKPDTWIYSREEFHKLLPDNLYKDENNPSTWAKKTLSYSSRINTANEGEIRLTELNRWKDGKYRVEVSATDIYGNKIEETRYFTLWSNDKNKLPHPATSMLIFPRTRYEPGDTLELFAGTGASGAKVIIEIEQDRNILDSRSVLLKPGLHRSVFPVREEFRGNVGVNYLFIYNNRLYSHSQRVTVPYTNKELDIAFETFRDRLEPGENEEWRIRISGRSGERIAAEMVATLYDASLDQFAINNFNFNLNRYWNPVLTWITRDNFESSYGSRVITTYYYGGYYPKPVPDINWFGLNYHYRPSFYFEKHDQGIVVVLFREDAPAINISGEVKNMEGDPLPGATVRIKGVDNQAISGEDGSFSLQYDAAEAELLIENTGFVTESLRVAGNMVLDIRLVEDFANLTEIDVPGYGEVTRSELRKRSELMFLETARSKSMIVMDDMALEEEVFAFVTVADEDAPPPPPVTQQGKTDEIDLDQIEARTNFNETAFFYPTLHTNESGEIIIKFTIPQSLTRWKMQAFAHTKDLMTGYAEKQLVTSKNLMVVPNIPRFLREGDRIKLTSNIVNISGDSLVGVARLMLFDALTMKPIDELLENTDADRNFRVGEGRSVMVGWDVRIPKGIEAVTYRVVAAAGEFSDGEEMAVPVLTNRTLVTESLPLWVNGNETRRFTHDKLVNNTSSTLRNHKLTLEFTANPAWYAIQALPYLMEFPYDCLEQVFSRYYANSIAGYIVNSKPEIKRVFDNWKMHSSDEFLSNLEKNQELKQLLIEETPWLADAGNEGDRKKRVALLFDLNKMADEENRALDKLRKGQHHDGAWPWFDGGPGNRFITQHIVNGFGHLMRMGVIDIEKDRAVREMLTKAIGFLDKELVREYNNLKNSADSTEMSKDRLSYMALHYLYGRSYFKFIKLPAEAVEAVGYYQQQSAMYWLNRSDYMQGMIALFLHREGQDRVPGRIINSLKERAIHSDEMGMYWKQRRGYFWYESPVETQALLIEAFDEITGDTKLTDAMKTWLLKNKQTNSWKTTKATTEACYALLMRGSDWLETESSVTVRLGDKLVDPASGTMKAEAGTGYFKTSWTGDEIKTSMGNVTITKTSEGPGWGALYWQYFEDLDKITSHETPLKLNKNLFKEVHTGRGRVLEPVTGNKLNVGDKVIVRIELRVDRAMEYVHMKDTRASGLEPVTVISGYKYQDGLGYYESTKDASVNFFFDRLTPGTYVFEYPLWVTHQGEFSNGITTIQSMYVPEFSSHSEGVRIRVN